MSNPRPKHPPRTVVKLDFSGKEAEQARNQREAAADAELRHDPEFRAAARGVAESERSLGRQKMKKFDHYVLGGLALAGITVGVDLGVGELFDMQQLLLGEDVRSWPQRITHGAILAIGGIPSAIGVLVGFHHGFEGEAHYSSSRSSGRF